MKVVIFDLSGVCICKTRYRGKRKLRLAYSKFDYAKYQAWIRPGLIECWQELIVLGIKIAIWTSNPHNRTHHIIDDICNSGKFERTNFYFIYDRDDCIVKADHSTLKPLAKLYDNSVITEKDEVLFIDDTVSKHVDNPAQQVLILPEFMVETKYQDSVIDYDVQYQFMAFTLPYIIAQRLGCLEK